MLTEEGYKLMVAAFEVYNQLGYGKEVYKPDGQSEGKRSNPSLAHHDCSPLVVRLPL